MSILARAFSRTWFYWFALGMGFLYGLGGLVHVANILGFGERPWTDSPLSWQLGDILWGGLDITAAVGIPLRSTVGLIALVLAALSQLILYGFYPELFALQTEHFSTLQSLVYLNATVLFLLTVLIYFAGDHKDR